MSLAREPGVVIDNDVILKSACYGITELLWPSKRSGPPYAILGAARFVITKRIGRTSLRSGGSDRAADLLAGFFAMAETLEPNGQELSLAATIELQAQRRGLPLDAGESQLAAIAALRRLEAMETGDKRAVRGIETLLSVIADLEPLRGRVWSFEQIIRYCITDGDSFDAIAVAICGEPAVDTTMSICFSCHGPADPDLDEALTGLQSYIGSLRAQAPTTLSGD